MGDTKNKKIVLIMIIVVINIICIFMASISIIKSIKKQLSNKSIEQDIISDEEVVINDKELTSTEEND